MLAIAGVVVVAIALGLGIWRGTATALNVLHPSGEPKLALLRKVPHPAGAVEIGHRTHHGSKDLAASAWLTYRMPAGTQDVCSTVIATFEANHLGQEWLHAADPIAAYCRADGSGIASYCVPKVICFDTAFSAPGQDPQYTLGTGSGSG
jgi:hypothetical protein